MLQPAYDILGKKFKPHVFLNLPEGYRSGKLRCPKKVILFNLRKSSSYPAVPIMLHYFGGLLSFRICKIMHSTQTRNVFYLLEAMRTFRSPYGDHVTSLKRSKMPNKEELSFY